MPRATLTDIAARKASPRSRLYELSTSGGLYREVILSGAKCWRIWHMSESEAALRAARRGIDYGLSGIGLNESLSRIVGWLEVDMPPSN